jgi:putative addiction module component (TIGR02574 family)
MEKSFTSSEIKKLSVPERILLVEEIWDSITAEPEMMEVTAAQKRELDQRLNNLEAGPDKGRSWEEVKSDLKLTK